jgi:hypothetical protein
MWCSVEQLAFNPVSAEVPSTAASVAAKPSAHPTRTAKTQSGQDVQDFLQRKLIIEAHFASRKSLL